MYGCRDTAYQPAGALDGHLQRLSGAVRTVCRRIHRESKRYDRLPILPRLRDQSGHEQPGVDGGYSVCVAGRRVHGCLCHFQYFGRVCYLLGREGAAEQGIEQKGITYQCLCNGSLCIIVLG